MTAASVLEDAGIDFGELDLDEGTEATPGPLTGSRSSGKSGSRGGGRGRSTTKSKLDALQKKLSAEMFQAGALIGMGLPVTGYYTCQESDNFTHAVVELAAHRKEWVEALEHIADIGPGIIIGRTAVGLGASLAVDRGRADPEKKFMQLLGVHAAWMAVQEGPGREEGNAYTPPPGPAFSPVS